MGHASDVRSRARRRAARRCAPPVADASVLELLRSVEVDGESESGDAEPFPETPDVFEPEPEFELPLEPELEAEAPRRLSSPLARALAVAVDVEEACEANDNVSAASAEPDPAPFVPLAPSPPKLPEPAATADEEDPPFDAPDADDDIFRPPPHARRWSDPADVLDLHTPAPPIFASESEEVRPPARPAPAISIHVSWDRSAGSELAQKLANEPLLTRIDVSDARGGVGGAAASLAKINPPDLLLLETTLKAGPLLEAVDALLPSLAKTTKVFIVGDVNDVTLLRDLARRGVVHYFLAPADTAEIARAICDLHAETDKSRVIAVIGSRGGAGASVVAHNLAWSLAERHGASATLIELDIAFGATAFSFDRRPTHSIADGVRDPQSINEAFLDRVGVMQTDRLRLVAAPAALGEELALDRSVVGALIRNARRMSKVVVLDVPHHWDACIKDVLERANDVIIVAPPDLASLRNTKNLLDVLKGLRPAAHEPMVVLSMVGAAKASEISAKDFAGAIDAEPIMSFEFDPALFAGSVLKRQMLAEAAPQSTAARQVDELVGLITGRKVVKHRKRERKAETQMREDLPLIAPLELTAVPEPPSEPEAPDEREPDVVVELTEALIADAAAPSENVAPAAPRRRRPHPLSRRQVKPTPRRLQAQPGTLRLAAALLALLATSMWYVEKRTGVDVFGYAIAAPR